MRRNLSTDDSASDHSVGDYIKLTLIGLKILFLFYKMVKTMMSNTKAKHKFMIVINVMAVLYIVELMMFNMLMRTDHISNDENALKRLLPFNIVYTLSFIVLLVIMFIPQVGAYCSVIQVYHYFSIQITTSLRELMISERMHVLGKILELKISRKQTKCFTYFNLGTAISQFIIGLVGVFKLEQSGGVVACDEDNNVWLQINTGGNVFITLHIILIIMQCSMFFLTFQKAPQDAGLFGGNQKLTEKRKLNDQSQKPHKLSINVRQKFEDQIKCKLDRSRNTPDSNVTQQTINDI
ncbi:UNKNOWN [Stylonychia lemnae]|uniref:Uncharacterized protein n=1 Tax=Stylonychia lemnae TaxID=5949 RepID=A0A078AEQ0_STYLE|nr:UNKNOWN [Stylonychia lemnae]|eukprot:CDW80749.1 UNKNOWN [Stylonychia lemnae]